MSEYGFVRWLARVEDIVGHGVDVARARSAYYCDMYPKQQVTAEEYAEEITRDLRRVLP